MQQVFTPRHEQIAMDAERIVVSCQDCEFCESFSSLGQARLALAEHESAGHAVDWQLSRLAAGVERAGADAGICGIDGCENPDSPLVEWSADQSTPHDETSRNYRDEEP